MTMTSDLFQEYGEYDPVNKIWIIDPFYLEEGFPFAEWDKFPGYYCSTKKTMEEFKQAWMECGAYDPVNKVWSEEKMNIHLHELYRAECGLSKCVCRLRNEYVLMIK